MKTYYVCDECLEVMEENDPKLRVLIGSARTMYFCKKHFKSFVKRQQKDILEQRKVQEDNAIF